MPWITLNEDHIKARLAEDELYSIEGTGGGAGNRLAGIIIQVTAMVRAKVAACHKNKLGPSGTIPEECLHSAATIAKHNIRASLSSTGSEDEGELRKDEYREAITFLNKVASCDIGIEAETGQVSGRASGCYGGEPYYNF